MSLASECEPVDPALELPARVRPDPVMLQVSVRRQPPAVAEHAVSYEADAEADVAATLPARGVAVVAAPAPQAESHMAAAAPAIFTSQRGSAAFASCGGDRCHDVSSPGPATPNAVGEHHRS